MSHHGLEPADFENPSPGSFNFYTFKGMRFRCRECGWQGLGEDLKPGEMFSELYELDCPSCSARISCVMYPTINESRDSWSEVSPADRIQVEVVEQLQKKFADRKLKAPADLPELPDGEITLTWDQEGRDTVVKLGETVLFSEPAIFEGYERYMEVAKILKERYGDRLTGLLPSPRSYLDLYGDKIAAPSMLREFHIKTFGTKLD